MRYRPKKYQVKALDFALKNKCCGLFMRMGTGKTVVVLTLINLLMRDAIQIRRVLLVAPLRVARITWPDEVAKWDHTKKLTYKFLHGSRKDCDLLEIEDTDITAVNFDGLQWLYNNRHKAPRFDMVIVDESTWIKNPSAFRTEKIHALTRFIPRKIILTGSPSPNSLMDLWSQIFVLDRGRRLGENISHFRNKYFFPNDTGYGHYLRSGSKKAIVDKIADIVLVVEDKGLKGMPKILNNKIPFKLPNSLMKKYTEIQRKFFTTLDSGHTIDTLNKQANTQKLRQFVTGFVYDSNYNVVEIHKERVKVLKELIESINRNVLVAVQYKAEVELIRKYLGKAVPFINSNSSDEDDDKNIRLWQQGKLPILLAHPSSIGYGLNLQGGGWDIIWFSLTWSLEEWEQFIKRLARLGQLSKIVMNHILIAIGTVDEPIFLSISKKDAIQQDVINGLKAWRDLHENRRNQKVHRRG